MWGGVSTERRLLSAGFTTECVVEIADVAAAFANVNHETLSRRAREPKSNAVS